MEKFDRIFTVTTHPKDRFRIIHLLDKSDTGYSSCGWDTFVLTKEQLELLRDNEIKCDIVI